MLSVPILWIGEKNGSGRHSLVDGRGVPLSLVIVGANRHDVTQVAAVLDGKVVEPVASECEEAIIENLCADAGYDSKKAREEMVAHGYVPHIRSRGEEMASKAKNPEYKARRWVIEVSHSWYNLFRKLTIRYEKKARNWVALHNIAAAIIALRKITMADGTNFIYG
jgi:IS5 family transposase